MKISIPDYLLKSVLRHYSALADAYLGHDNIKAANAKRVAHKEIKRVMNLINMQYDNSSDKSISGKESAIAR